jgi:transcriptional regulator with XRE-family HTH domain
MTRRGRYAESLTGRPVTAFGQWIVDRMERRGINQSQMAATMGVSRQQVNTLLYEPMARIQVRTCVALAEALDVRLIDVVTALDLPVPLRDRI